MRWRVFSHLAEHPGASELPRVVCHPKQRSVLPIVPPRRIPVPEMHVLERRLAHRERVGCLHLGAAVDCEEFVRPDCVRLDVLRVDVVRGEPALARSDLQEQRLCLNFSVFVPSLSWRKMIIFSTKQREKNAFFRTCSRPSSGSVVSGMAGSDFAIREKNTDCSVESRDFGMALRPSAIRMSAATWAAGLSQSGQVSQLCACCRNSVPLLYLGKCWS